MLKTIVYVKEPNPWMAADKANPQGPKQLKGHFINVGFDDGSEASCLEFGAMDKAKAVYDALVGLKGTPTDFTIEERTYNGQVKRDLKSWPGRAAAPAGGFRGGARAPYVPAYAQTKEGFDVTQRSIQRAVALERALQHSIANGGPNDQDAILNLAERYYVWLSSSTHADPPKQDEPHPTSNGSAKSKAFEDFTVWLKNQTSSDPEDKRKAWELAKKVAAKHSLNDETMKSCNSSHVFDAIKKELQAIAKGGDDAFPF